MSEYVDGALARHDAGFNCAQSVACAFAERLGVDEGLLFRATEGLGLGMGCMEGTCGALSGACIVAGLACSGGDLSSPRTKGATYKVSRQLVEGFGEVAGATICKDIKGVGTGKMLYACHDCVALGAKLTEEMLDARE